MNIWGKLSVIFGGIIPDAFAFAHTEFAGLHKNTKGNSGLAGWIKPLPLVQWLVLVIKNLLISKRLLKAAKSTFDQGPTVRKRYRPGDVVPESGIYRVTHDSHRLMHEATLLEGQLFPICRQCRHEVRFELRRAVKNPTQISGYHAILEDFPDVEPYIVN